jgi:hypothetical protein
MLVRPTLFKSVNHPTMINAMMFRLSDLLTYSIILEHIGVGLDCIFIRWTFEHNTECMSIFYLPFSIIEVQAKNKLHKGIILKPKKIKLVLLSSKHFNIKTWGMRGSEFQHFNFYYR